MADRWPDFFVAGAGRAGTTSLHNYLDRHPEIFMSGDKEPRFFGEVWDAAKREGRLEEATEAYLDHFAPAGDTPVAGESSVTYMYHPRVPERILSRVPDARVAVTLRDPIERAVSHYWLNVARGIESRPIDEAVAEDLAADEVPHDRDFVGQGFYAEPVERLDDAFGPRFRVVLFADLVEEPRSVVREMARFLEVDTDPVDELDLGRQHNPTPGIPPNRIAQRIRSSDTLRRLAQSVLPKRVREYLGNEVLLADRDKPDLDPATRRRLEAAYAPDVARLEDHLGRELPELRRSWTSDAAEESI